MRIGDLEVVPAPGHHLDGEFAVPLDAACGVGALIPLGPGAAIGPQQLGGAERLRRLHPDESGGTGAVLFVASRVRREDAERR